MSRGINFERLSFNNFLTQTANHVECHGEISRKHELFKNLRAYIDGSHDIGGNVFSVTPLTFYLKIAPEKGAYSVKQQMALFKQVYSLLEEFKEVFSQPDCDEDTAGEVIKE